MPVDKLHPPDQFDDMFKVPLMLGQGEHEVFVHEDKKRALNRAKKFRAFVKSIRAYPLHHFNQILESFDIRTSTRKRDSDSYALYITLKPKIDWFQETTPK